MSEFAYELAMLVQAVAQARPAGDGDPARQGAYALPWYLVVGEPGSGRSSAVRALNLSWPRGEAALALGMPSQLCSYWLPEKAAFIEPGPMVLGPQRGRDHLYQLCAELKEKRAREPLDGILLVLSVPLLVDATEDALERYAKALRGYLVEIGQGLAADVPVYVVVSGYDALWGFGDAFRWGPDRRDEGPWGFALPVGTDPLKCGERVAEALAGLMARIEAVCFWRLSGDDPPEVRARALQHLAEARDLVDRLRELLRLVTMPNAFERTPWVRALVLGSATPGTGQRLRHGAARFQQLALALPQQSGTAQPGGMPIHGLLERVLLPERDIVPTKKRWRDDWLFLAALIGGAVAWLGLGVVLLLRALV